MSENEPSCPSPSSTLPSLYKADPLKRRRQQQRSRTRKHTRKNSLQHAGEIVRARGLPWKDTHAGPQWVCAKVPGENEDLSVNTSPLEQVGARPKRDHDSQRSDATDGGVGIERAPQMGVDLVDVWRVRNPDPKSKRQAAAPYLAASLSTLALDAHIAAHISLVP